MRLLVLLVTVLLVAVGARWSQLPGSMALGDSLGPFLVAARGPWSTAPHAPPYGWLLAVPHALVLPFATDLYSAFAAIRVVDALVAPIGAWTALRLTGRTGSALSVGLLLALDPGLLDTATSGAEAYQAPVAIALVALATTFRTRGAWLAAVAFPWAVMAHPLSTCLAPLLVRVRWRVAPLLLMAGLLGPHLWGLLHHSPERAPPALPIGALTAWFTQGQAAAVLFVAALGAGLVIRRTRSLMVPTLASLGLLLLAGTRLGYLRDHHVRLVSAPTAVGLAALPSPIALVGAATALRWPTGSTRRGAHRRPGTLGLLHTTTTAIAAARPSQRPLVVDGVRTVHVPAVEPGGVWLDLLLRGTPTAALDINDNTLVAVIVTGKRHADVLRSPGTAGLTEVFVHDTVAVWTGTAEDITLWSGTLCTPDSPPPRVGGAWDGLALVHPERGAASVSGWWACQQQ